MTQSVSHRAADDGAKLMSAAQQGGHKVTGLHDMHGNLSEWVEDCGNESYQSAPSDGSAWLEEDGGDCGRRVLRGGSWVVVPDFLRSADRVGNNPVTGTTLSAFGLPGRSAESGACPLNLHPFTSCDLGEAQLSALFLPQGALQRTLWDGKGAGDGNRSEGRKQGKLSGRDICRARLPLKALKTADLAHGQLPRFKSRFTFENAAGRVSIYDL